MEAVSLCLYTLFYNFDKIHTILKTKLTTREKSNHDTKKLNKNKPNCLSSFVIILQRRNLK